MKGRILIAGVAGFLGCHLARRLLGEGYEVVGLDNFVTGTEANAAWLAGDPAFSLVSHDVCRPLPFRDGFDGVLHLASPASPPDFLRLPIETLEAGSLGTRNLLELALGNGARFLLASTSEVYGDPQLHPQPEGYSGNVNPVGPRSAYDEAKRFSEAISMAYHRVHGLSVGIARIFNTYGPRMRPDDGRVVSNFLVQALRGYPLTIYGDGTQTRSFCYVDDLVEGLLRLFESGHPGVVNLGNPAEYTVSEVARTVLQLVGGSSTLDYGPLPEDDPKVRCPDITKARNLFGWEPVVSLPEGLARTLPYFRDALGDRGSG